MPGIGDVVARLVAFVGDLINDSSLRLGLLPTIGVLAVLLVLLSLVARPTTRWTTRDLGRFASLGQSMARAAEAGATATFSLGTAGVARAVAAGERLQTLAGLPLLGQVARAAARSGVPLHVTTNDPITALLAGDAVDDAHRRTDTPERRRRSTVEFVGEGRAASAGLALSSVRAGGAGHLAGGAGQESLLLASGVAAGDGTSRLGLGEASEAPSVLLLGDGALIGADLFAAPADLRGTGQSRTAVVATNRLIGIAAAVLVLALAWALLGGDPAAALAAR
jgi:hypothetical protein